MIDDTLYASALIDDVRASVITASVVAFDPSTDIRAVSFLPDVYLVGFVNDFTVTQKLGA